MTGTDVAALPPARWLRAVGELVLPRACAGCGVPGTWWCASCASVLRARPRLLGAGPASVAHPPVACHAVAPYRGPAGGALVAAKERSVGALVPVLGEALAAAVRAAAAGARAGTHRDSSSGPGAQCRIGPAAALALVPVPSRPAAVRARGADVLAAVARAAALRLRADGLDAVAVPSLVHARAVRDQASLDAADRAANLAGALRVRRLAVPVLRARTVVVVNDVVTTGATLAEAARAVAGVLDVAPVAATVACADRVRWSSSPDPLVAVRADD